jgi:hypothetical protein
MTFYEGGKVKRSNATPIIFFLVMGTFLENFGKILHGVAQGTKTKEYQMGDF